MKNLETLMIEKLRESALHTPTLQKHFEFTPLDAKKTSSLGKNFSKRSSFKIPYFGIDGKKTDFFRVRYLTEQEEGKPSSFIGKPTSKPPKYMQPSGTVPPFYFPVPMPKMLSWLDVAEDPKLPILITEGELKACAAVVAGHHCIGIGGVWSWKNKALSDGVVPDFELIKWSERPVYLCFDSDVRTNHNVMRALHELSKELTTRGALPFIVAVPALRNNVKAGIDDYLVAKGKQKFQRLIDKAEPFELTSSLWSMNERFTYVKRMSEVFDFETYTRLTVGDFRTLLLNKKERVLTTDENGVPKIKEAFLSKLWLEWPNRSEVHLIDMRPGCEDRVILVEEGTHIYAAANAWKGWGKNPADKCARKDVALWDELMQHVFPPNDANARLARWWFERWLAYPLQNPGAKILSACLLWSPETGSGKSAIGETMGEIYGVNIGYTNPGNSGLFGNFNSWLLGKTFVQVDEVSSRKGERDIEYLKDIITRTTVLINEKGQKEFMASNCFNLYLTANHPNVVHIDMYDRRYFIHEIVGEMSMDFWPVYFHWLRNDGGASKLFRYFLDLDMSEPCPDPTRYRAQYLWSPNLPPPITDAKIEAQETTRSNIEDWIVDKIDNPIMYDGIEHIADLWTPKQLADLYRFEREERIDYRRIGRVLKKLRVPMVSNCVRVGEQKITSVYAIKHVPYWKEQEKTNHRFSEVVRKHLIEAHGLKDTEKEKF